MSQHSSNARGIVQSKLYRAEVLRRLRRLREAESDASEAMARRLFGAGSAVGEKLWFGDRKEGPGVEVIGVTANSKHLTMGEKQAFAVYHDMAQERPSGTEINVFARAGLESIRSLLGDFVFENGVPA